VGFVYLCSPNNPTGRIVTRQEVAQLLNGIPEDVPVLIDEAYHHFVEDPAYATSVPYVLEGRQVIVTRTFSKIAALAGMRLGYGVAPRPLLQRMRPYGTGSINAVVKWGGVAALKDTASQAWVKKTTLELRGKTTAALQTLGYTVVPSDANFFMVHLRRPVQPVVDEFRKKGVLVGRPFPALPEHLRISVGTADEMGRFMTAFKEIMQPGRAAGDSRSR
jgi:histidinol-phosphate aminotransferase